MRLSSSAVAVVLAVGLLATACSGDDAASESPTPDPTTTTSPEPGDDPTTAPPADDDPMPDAEVGAMGSFTVDGQTFAVTDLNRCDPFFDEPGNIDLQAIAVGAILNLPVLGGGTSIDISVQGSALVELAGSNVFGEVSGEPAFAVVDDRISGSATLGDTMGSDAVVEVTFDVAIPDEIREC